MALTKGAVILEACQLSFNGVSGGEIAKKFGVDESIVSRWRKLDIWIEFEKELLATYKKALLDAQLEKGAKAESLAQG